VPMKGNCIENCISAKSSFKQKREGTRVWCGGLGREWGYGGDNTPKVWAGGEELKKGYCRRAFQTLHLVKLDNKGRAQEAPNAVWTPYHRLLLT